MKKKKINKYIRINILSLLRNNFKKLLLTTVTTVTTHTTLTTLFTI